MIAIIKKVQLSGGDRAGLLQRQRQVCSSQATPAAAPEQADASEIPSPPLSGDPGRSYADGYEDGKNDGYDLGFAAGLAQGEAEGAAQAARTAQERQHQLQEAFVAAVRAELARADQTLEAAAQALAIELAWTAILRLLGTAAGKRESVQAMVAEVMQQLGEHKPLRVCVAPADLALLQPSCTGEAGAAAAACQAQASASEPGFDEASKRDNGDSRALLRHLQLQPDERVGMGGCIIVCEAGDLDGRLESQLLQLKAVLLAQAGLRPA